MHMMPFPIFTWKSLTYTYASHHLELHKENTKQNLSLWHPLYGQLSNSEVMPKNTFKSSAYLSTTQYYFLVF